MISNDELNDMAPEEADATGTEDEPGYGAAPTAYDSTLEAARALRVNDATRGAAAFVSGVSGRVGNPLGTTDQLPTHQVPGTRPYGSYVRVGDEFAPGVHSLPTTTDF